MSEDKENLQSIKVYKFINTKESWHEFTLKFRVIADYRGYDDIIEGKETAPDEKENLEIVEKDYEETTKSKKAKQLARTANRKGFRDLVMSTDGISLSIVQSSTSDKLSKGDLKKAWGRLEMLEPQDQRGQGPFVHQVSKLQAGECKTKANGLAGIHGEEEKRTHKHRAYYG